MKKEKGITLIALIITIVILVILTAITINNVMSADLFGLAKGAAENYIKAGEEEQEMLSDLTEEMHPGWTETEEGITNGISTVHVGDYIAYTPSAETYISPTGTYIEEEYASAPENLEQGSGYSEQQEFDTTTYKDGWRVLGVDKVTHELQIISARPVLRKDGGNYYLRGYTGIKYAEIELNNICKIFGKGEGAKSARTLNYDEVCEITGYKTISLGKSKFEWGNKNNEIIETELSNGNKTIYTSDCLVENGFNYAVFENNDVKWINDRYEVNKEIAIISFEYKFYIIKPEFTQKVEVIFRRFCTRW